MRSAKKKIQKGLLTVALAGAIVLLVAATQQKPLPNERDLDAALKKILANANDLDANTTVGRYYAFVEEEWNKAVPFIQNGKDKAMIALIEEEKKDDNNKFTATEIGDKWLKEGDKAGALKPYFRDRAIDWYGKGWERGVSQDPVWSDQLRKRLETLQATVGGKGSRAGKVPNWDLSGPEIGTKYVRRGQQSIKLIPGTYGFSSLAPAKEGKEYKFSAWVLADKTNQIDAMSVRAYDNAGNIVFDRFINIPPDNPFWKKIMFENTFPAGTTKFNVGMHIRSNQGAVWIDTVSLKVDGVEQIKNPSFEP